MGANPTQALGVMAFLLGFTALSGGLFAGPPWVLGGGPDLTKAPGVPVARF